tara:strand:+ start:430 stop:1296 length:867 start_codon:yes stop_codon:yes gene_type:complete
MANPVTSASLYAGEAGAYIGAAVLSGKTLSEGNVTIKEGVKKAIALTVVSDGGLIEANDCAFDANTMTFTDRMLTPTDKKLNLELCATDLEKDWQAAQMKAGSNNSAMSSDFNAFLMGYLGEAIGSNIESQIWSDLKTAATADSDVTDVTGTTLDASNILTEIGKVRDAVSATVWGKDDLKYYCGTNAIRFYMTKMATQGYLNAYQAADIPLMYEGVELVHAPGMAADTIIASRVSNLFVGTDLLSDAVNFKVIDMRETTGANSIRIAANFAFGANHAVGGDVVLYSS